MARGRKHGRGKCKSLLLNDRAKTAGLKQKEFLRRILRWVKEEDGMNDRGKKLSDGEKDKVKSLLEQTMS